jgi:transposase
MLPGGNVTLRLRSGFRYRYPLRTFEKIAAGDAIASQLSLRQKTVRESDGRNGMRTGDRVDRRVICSILFWLPRNPINEQARGTLFVRTDSDALLIALNTRQDKLWVKNADRVRDWLFQHRRWLQRVADDSKFERRHPRRRRRRTLLEYGLRATKYRSRLKTYIDQTAAEVIGYAVRRQFRTLNYNDSDRRFLSAFPWQQLLSALKLKAEFEGLEFIHDSSAVMERVESTGVDDVQSEAVET